MTTTQRALLAWRSPPRLSRQRVTLPDDAWMGATPHRCAHAASERNRWGCRRPRPATWRRCRPRRRAPRASWARWRRRGGEQRVDGGELVVEGQHPTSEDAHRRLGRGHHRVAAGPRPQPGRDTAEVVAADAAQSVSQLVGRGEAEVADLVERLDPRRAGGALGDHQGADGLDVAVAGLARALRSARQRRSRRFHRVGGIGLAGAPARLAARHPRLVARQAAMSVVLLLRCAQAVFSS